MKKESSMLIALLFSVLLSGCDENPPINAIPMMQMQYEIPMNTESVNVLRSEDRLIKTESYLFYLDDKYDLTDEGLEFQRDIPYLIRIDRTNSRRIDAELPSTSRGGVQLLDQAGKLLFWGTDGERAILQIRNFNLEVEREVAFPLAENGICVATTDDAVFLACQNAVYKITFDQGLVSQYNDKVGGISCIEADGNIVMLGVLMPDQSFFLRILDFSGSPQLLKDLQEMVPSSISKGLDNSWLMIGGSQNNFSKMYTFNLQTLQLMQIYDFSNLVKKHSLAYFPKVTGENMLSLLTETLLEDGEKSLLYLYIIKEGEVTKRYYIELPTDDILSNIEISNEQLHFFAEKRTDEKVIITEYICSLNAP